MSYQWGSGYQGRSYAEATSGSGYQGRLPDEAASGSGYQGRPNDKANTTHRLRLHNYKGPYNRNALRSARDELMARVQRCSDSVVWRSINNKTNIYGYRYSDSRDDGYGDPSSIFSHAGDPGEMLSDDLADDSSPHIEIPSEDEDGPSTSTGFRSCPDSSMNDSSVSREMNVGTEGDNVGETKHKHTADSGSLFHGESDTADNSSTNVQKSSLMIDGRSPLKDFSVSMEMKVTESETSSDAKSANDTSYVAKSANDTSSVAKSAKSIQKKSSMVVDGRSPFKNFSVTKIVGENLRTVGKVSSESKTQNGVTDKSVKGSVECVNTVDLTNDSLDEANTSIIVIEDPEDGELPDIIQIEDDKEGTGSMELDVVIEDLKEEGKNVKKVRSKARSGKDLNDKISAVVTQKIVSLRTQADKEGSTESDVVVEDLESDDEQAVVQKMSQAGLQKMFQCEFCLIVTETKPEILVHLKKELHYSASSVFATSEKVVVYLSTSTAVKYDHPDVKKLAVCPAMFCKQIFKNASDCASHSSLSHVNDNLRGYGVVDVINRESVPVNSLHMICNKCGFEFDKLKSLKKHYQKEKHYPYMTRPGCESYTVCNLCPDRFFTEFCYAVHHVTRELKTKHAKKIIDGKFTLMVLTLGCERKLVEFPPFIPSKQGENEAICSKIRSLKRIKRRFGKSAKKKANATIRDLKGLLV